MFSLLQIAKNGNYLLNFITMNHMLQLLLHTFLDLGEKYDGCHFALKNTFTPH